jgi:vancomycin resistance protein YoaR
LVLSLFVASLCLGLIWLEGAGRVFPNVSVGPVAAGGLARADLMAALMTWRNSLPAVLAPVVDPAPSSDPGGGEPAATGRGPAVEFVDIQSGRTWLIARDVMGLRLDIEATIDEAYDVGRGGGAIRALVALVSASTHGVRVDPSVVLNRDQLGVVLANIAADVNIAAVNPSLDPRTGAIRFGRTGRILDPRATEEGLRSAEAHGLVRVPLAFTPAVPRGDAARLLALDRDCLGFFSTSFDPADTDRTWNIALAAARLDGTVLAPQDVVSFNEIVGERTREAGFREAPEIVDNELVPGYGGGVCQVATTVFNAALLSDLEIVRRYHHSRPLGYVGLGRDATVSYPDLDLVVRNCRAFPIILAAAAEGGEISVSFWGRRAMATEIRLWTAECNLKTAAFLEETSAKLPAGARSLARKPFDGRDVQLWREVVCEGKVVRRELIGVDHYEPIPGVAQVGPVAPAEDPGEPDRPGRGPR